MIDIDRDKPVYVIGVVAEMLGVTQQALRLYEKENLVAPKRTSKKTRLYSIRDVEDLQRIIRLHQDLGVNIAGIEIILNMRRKMEAMQGEFQEMVDALKERLNIEWAGGAFSADPDCTDLIPVRPARRPGETTSKELALVIKPPLKEKRDGRSTRRPLSSEARRKK